MINYEHAHNLYNNTKKPPRSKKYLENQRPLRRVGKDHLMLQKDAHSYMYRFYNKEVMRLYEPNEHGEYEVAIKGVYGNTSLDLAWKFLGISSAITLTTTTGDQVRVPLNSSYKKQDKEFSAVLVFDKENKLIVERSWHADVYKLVSTDEDKQKRKDLKKELDAYVTLQMFKLPTLRDNCNPDESMGAPFGESGLSHSYQSTMRDALRNLPLPLDSQAFMETFDKVAQDVFDMLASKKVYAESGGNLFWKARGRYFGQQDPAEKDDAKEKIEDIVASITPEEYKKSLVARLISYANLTKGTKSVALPQFANTLPRTYYIDKA